MPGRSPVIEVSIESGEKRVFASALDWPGWCRSGRDRTAALEALIAYGPRYAEVVRGTRTSFGQPKEVSDLKVVERRKGDATTDFGAPGKVSRADAGAVDARELRRLRTLLHACWSGFDRAAKEAEGVELRKGPRGGGRDLLKIVSHVVSAEAGYVRRIAAKPPDVDEKDPWASVEEVREVALEAMERAVKEGLPERGTRGGAMWPLRYFVRRTSWHALDHAWEIQDRSSGPAS
ncbi:MAG: hypothetical protein M3O88_05370 [Actinomycetota bacterium]|nr:hypothetical protein [Actinomycetota bacterium]